MLSLNFTFFIDFYVFSYNNIPFSFFEFITRSIMLFFFFYGNEFCLYESFYSIANDEKYQIIHSRLDFCVFFTD